MWNTFCTSWKKKTKPNKNKRKHKVGQKRQRQICARLTNRETTADADPQRKVVPFLETACRLRSQHTISARSDAAMFPENRIEIKIEGRSWNERPSFPMIHQSCCFHLWACWPVGWESLCVRHTHYLKHRASTVCLFNKGPSQLSDLSKHCKEIQFKKIKNET